MFYNTSIAFCHICFRPASESEVRPFFQTASSSVSKQPSTAKKSLNFGSELPRLARQPVFQSQSPPLANQLEIHLSHLDTATRNTEAVETAKRVSATSDELDVTDYFFPPGASPFGQKLLHRESDILPAHKPDSDILTTHKPEQPEGRDHNGGVSGGPTVKELLSSFTDRMRASLDLSMTWNDRNGKDDVKVPSLDLEKLDEESELSSGELSSNQDSTLIEDKDRDDPIEDGMEQTVPDQSELLSGYGNPASDTLQETQYSGNVSRYSVTDYFNKYPKSNNKRKPHVSDANDFRNVEATREFDDELFELPERIGTSDLSKQGSLYKGTILDTSLSTITAAEVVSVGTGSTTSVTSTTSLDDHMFREGLARLDADIEKIQLTLRHTSA